MKKNEELNLKFYKKYSFGEKRSLIDSNNATDINKGLHFIDILNDIVITDLIDNITLIQNNMDYDKSFLENAEEFTVFNMTFIKPFFSIGGYQTIHMNDLKILLEEWLEFKNS